MHCWARSLFTVVVIALGTLSMIDACGQKGPLYLPEQTPDQPSGKPTQKQPQEAPATGTETARPAVQGATPPSTQ